MKSILISVALIAGLIGCTTIPDPQIVNVPIKTKCEPLTNIKDIDKFPVDEAKKDMSLYDKLKLVLFELELIRDQNLELKAALKECTK